MATRTWLAAAIFLGLALANARADEPSPAATKVTLMKHRLEAAQKAYRQVWDDQGGGPESAYQWSRRWLDAERALRDKTEDRIAALRAHRERMRELEQVSRRQFQERIATLVQLRASEYYVAEAELWVFQAVEESKGRLGRPKDLADR